MEPEKVTQRMRAASDVVSHDLVNPRPTHCEFLPVVTGWVTMSHFDRSFSEVAFIVIHPLSRHLRAFC